MRQQLGSSFCRLFLQSVSQDDCYSHDAPATGVADVDQDASHTSSLADDVSQLVVGCA